MLLENSWGTLCPIPRWSSEAREAYRLLHDRIKYQLTTELDAQTRYILCDITHLASLSGLNDREDFLLPYGVPDTVLGQTQYSFESYAEGETKERYDTARWIAEHATEPSHTTLINLASFIDDRLTYTGWVTPGSREIVLLRLFARHDHRRLFFPGVEDKGYDTYALNLAFLRHSCTGNGVHSIRKLVSIIHSSIRRECLSEIDPVTRWNRCTGLSFYLLLVLYYHRIGQLNTPTRLPVLSRLKDYLLYLMKDLPHV